MAYAAFPHPNPPPPRRSEASPGAGAQQRKRRYDSYLGNTPLVSNQRRAFGRCVAPAFNVNDGRLDAGYGHKKPSVSDAQPPDVHIHSLDMKPIIDDDFVACPLVCNSDLFALTIRQDAPGWFVIAESTLRSNETTGRAGWTREHPADGFTDD